MEPVGDGAALEEPRTVELLEELVGRWRDDGGASLTLAVRDHQVVGLVVFGLTAHAANLCAAIVALYRADEPAAIVALTRQVTEACITAVWVELCGRTAAEALMAEQSRQLVNELNEFVRLGMSGGEAALQSLSADKRWFLAHSAGRYVEQRCREIEGGDAIYAIYRAASELSHASTAVVDMYLHEPRSGSGAPVALRYTPRVDLRPWITAALTLFVHAGLSFDRLDPEHKSRARFRQVARELGVSPRIQLSAEGMRAQRARTRAERSRRRSGAQRQPSSATTG